VLRALSIIINASYHVDFKLGDFTVWVKKKFQEENRFKSLFNIVNRLNSSTKITEKEEKMKKLEKNYKTRVFEYIDKFTI
jgi:hypothetical protein